MLQSNRRLPLALTLLFTLTFPGVSLAQDKGAKVEVLEKTTVSWDGDSLPVYPQGQPEITILKITIAPGQQLPVHKHPYINAGVLVRGQLTVVTDKGKTRHLKAGQALAELVDKWHYGKNDGAEPAEIIVFYAGIKGQPITIIKDDNTHQTESSTQPQTEQPQ